MTDVQLLALIIRHEAGNQPLAARVAVAYAILNRAKRTGINLAQMAIGIELIEQRVTETNATIAQLVLEKIAFDQMGATHFHDISLVATWSDNLHFVGQIGSLFFYYEN